MVVGPEGVVDVGIPAEVAADNVVGAGDEADGGGKEEEEEKARGGVDVRSHIFLSATATTAGGELEMGKEVERERGDGDRWGSGGY